jgi:Tfp pilus assembly protein PilO
MVSNKQISTFLLVFAICVFIFTFKAIYPFVEKIKVDSLKLYSLRKEMAGLNEKEKVLPILKKRYQPLAASLAKIKNVFVDDSEPLGLLRNLETAAADSGVEISVFSLKLSEKEKEKALPAGLDFKISLLGSFPDCLSFLSRLQKLPYLIEVKDFRIARIEESQILSGQYQGLSIGDVQAVIFIKVLSKSGDQFSIPSLGI